ncbi:hypothetical protein HPB50_012133 [Hyalomma asiaticum]|uniref:Uncharacterized protein n=1 Tax=Hyalomma asiaticum TaxID=266040 RepID=A0ACB7THB1_HYAAI|nr:hypothetical protein HPB50_012133 [Hyalomma asiaticum]
MQRISDSTAAVTRMASIKRIPLIITGCERGKTSPLIVFGKESSSTAASDVNYVIAINADGCQVELTSWEAGRHEDYDRWKPLSHADMILTCFSIDSPDSLEESPQSGRPVLSNHSLSLSIILVGNKNRPNFLLTVPYPPTTKKDHMALDEGCTIAKDADASGSPGMPCLDPGWRDRGVRNREAGRLTQV